jgi:hypothetical protein
VNQQLTKVLRGKAIASLEATAAGPTLRFADGAMMTVLGTTQGTAQMPTGPIASVHENGAVLTVSFETGTPIAFALSDPGGSVIVRDASNRVVYAG